MKCEEITDIEYMNKDGAIMRFPEVQFLKRWDLDCLIAFSYTLY